MQVTYLFHPLQPPRVLNVDDGIDPDPFDCNGGLLQLQHWTICVSIANLQGLDKLCCMILVLSSPRLLQLLGPLDGANLPIGTRLQHNDAIPRQS